MRMGFCLDMPILMMSCPTKMKQNHNINIMTKYLLQMAKIKQFGDITIYSLCTDVIF